MTEAAIVFEGLGHAYRPGQWVFRDYAGSVRGGRVLAVLGPNGRGKTTLLKILLGALQPTAGRIEIASRPAFVPQLFQVGFDYSALDMVLMGRAGRIGLFGQPSREDEAAAWQALERFGLGDVAHRPFHELSGGQRQLTIFARALVAEARILILDEPTSALDLKNQVLVLDWIDALAHRDGLAVVTTTHHPHHALAVADDALLMFDASRHAVGPAADVLTEAALSELYGTPLRRVALEGTDGAAATFVPLLARRAAASAP